jgi:ferredoxin-NADP reductase
MHKYVVQGVDQITPTTLLLTLKKDQVGSPFAFQPGQYAVINFYKKHRPSVVRCFSIVSSPTEQEILQFSMRTKGRYTKALTRLTPGDAVTVRGPFGGFVFNKDRDLRTVFLAGGIGITPFMSMVRYAASAQAPNEINLVYSCQNQDDVPFADELKALQHKNPNFKVTFVIGQGPVDKFAGYQTAQGRITPELLDQFTSQNTAFKPTFLICGPPPFMKAVSSTLKSKGVQSSFILTEAFSQGPNRQTGKVKNWPLNMYVLTSVGVGLASFIVMAVDLLKTLPPSSILGSKANVTAETLTNSRQTDLDALVRSLPSVTTTAPESDAVKKAMADAQSAPTTTSPTPAANSNTAVPAPTAPKPAPTPAPTPPPCQTTQSGVTVC